MPLMSKPSEEAKIAILFVTAGALTLVWSGVWMLFLHDHAPETAPWQHYVCYGCLASGLVVLVIGLALGRIARAARQAEMPPEEITAAESKISHEAASRAPIVTPTGIGGAAVTNGDGTVAGNVAAQGLNPAGNDAVNPVAPVARVVPANPPNPPAGPKMPTTSTANAKPSATF
jgi:hypothetical protein